MIDKFFLVRLSALSVYFIITMCTRSTSDQELLALVEVNVVDIDREQVKKNQTILIQGNTIQNVGDSNKIPIPSRARVVNASGHFVIPGLWDMHVHLTDRTVLNVYLAYGIVGVRDMAAGMFVDPDSVQVWNRDIADAKRDGPQILRAGPLLDGALSGYAGTIAVNDSLSAHYSISKAQNQKADFIKVLGGLSRENFWHISNEAKSRKLDIVGHVPSAVGVMESASAMRSMEHLMGFLLACSSKEESLRNALTELREETNTKVRVKRLRQLKRQMIDTQDSIKSKELFARLRHYQTWQVPTLKGWDFDLRGISETTVAVPDEAWEIVPTEQRGEWRNAIENSIDLQVEQRRLAMDEFRMFQQITNAMKVSKVGILAGTDTPHTLVVPGLGLHQELQLLVESGFSPAEAIATATTNVAKFLELDHKQGKIASGYIADILIVRDDPLLDIRNTIGIEYVIRNGHLYGKKQQREFLENARMAYAQDVGL